MQPLIVQIGSSQRAAQTMSDVPGAGAGRALTLLRILGARVTSGASAERDSIPNVVD